MSKLGEKKGITRLKSSSLFGLCKMFELPLDKKKQFMIEMLNELLSMVSQIEQSLSEVKIDIESLNNENK